MGQRWLCDNGEMKVTGSSRGGQERCEGLSLISRMGPSRCPSEAGSSFLSSLSIVMSGKPLHPSLRPLPGDPGCQGSLTLALHCAWAGRGGLQRDRDLPKVTEQK